MLQYSRKLNFTAKCLNTFEAHCSSLLFSLSVCLCLFIQSINQSINWSVNQSIIIYKQLISQPVNQSSSLKFLLYLLSLLPHLPLDSWLLHSRERSSYQVMWAKIEFLCMYCSTDTNLAPKKFFRGSATVKILITCLTIHVSVEVSRFKMKKKSQWNWLRRGKEPLGNLRYV